MPESKGSFIGTHLSNLIWKPTLLFPPQPSSLSAATLSATCSQLKKIPGYYCQHLACSVMKIKRCGTDRKHTEIALILLGCVQMIRHNDP